MPAALTSAAISVAISLISLIPVEISAVTSAISLVISPVISLVISPVISLVISAVISVGNCGWAAPRRRNVAFVPCSSCAASPGLGSRHHHQPSSSSSRAAPALGQSAWLGLGLGLGLGLERLARVRAPG